MKNIALIFAGGTGSRMNSRAKPKQFLQLYGKEIIIHTIECFECCKDIDSICVVCKEDWIDYLKMLLVKFSISKVKWIVKGGNNGQRSIYNGLKALESNCPPNAIVLVHDGVRPFVDDVLIQRCIECVNEHGSAITVVPAIETIVSIENGMVKNITDRSKCFHAKAPQCFYFAELLSAHELAVKDKKENFIDSASLMQAYGHSLFTVDGDFDNIKITTPADFYTFRALYDVRENKQIFGI